MSTTKNWIAATAAVIALSTPFIGAAEARQDRHRDGVRVIELRNNDARFTVVRRDTSRFDRRFGSVRTPLIRQRINNQMRRISNAQASGRIGRFKSLRLRSRVFAIRSALQIATLDGRVTHGERRHLMSMLNANSNRIRNASFRGGNRRFR